jgi:hypothetical protein
VNGRRIASASGAASCALLLTFAQAAHAQEPKLAELGWLRELAGHCWQGTEADGAAADTQCYTLQFGRHLRGTIEIPGAPGEPPRLRGDSVWSWDAAKRKITVVTWASAGALGITDAEFDGDLVRFSFGPDVRSYWQRTASDGYVVVRERRDGEAWRAERRVNYRQAPPAPAR